MLGCFVLKHILVPTDGSRPWQGILKVARVLAHSKIPLLVVR
ncbi:MAG TPA: hypothetical protein VEV21_00150 [Burkholderiales bacterium]|nr:hypothetical protein [Burkholderiales bacterium]